MTLKSRIALYYSLFFILVLLGAALLLLTIFGVQPELFYIDDFLSEYFYFSSTPVRGYSVWEGIFENVEKRSTFLRIAGSSGAAFVFSIVSSGVFLRFFRRITASHLLFLYMFFFSISGEIIKLLVFLLNELQADQAVLIVLSRIGLTLFFTGLFSIFMISLYFLGFKFQQQGTSFVLMLCIAAFIATQLPLNSFQASAHSLLNPQFKTRILAVIGSLCFLTVLGYVYHIYEQFSKEEVIRTIAVISLMVGHSLLFFSNSAFWGLIALAILGTGIIIYLVRLFYDYFWY